jgi:hypothetical protein
MTTTLDDCTIADRLAAKIAMFALAQLRESVAKNPGETMEGQAIGLAGIPNALSSIRAHHPGFTIDDDLENHVITAAAGVPLLRAVASCNMLGLNEVNEKMIIEYLQKTIFKYLPFDDAPITAA